MPHESNRFNLFEELKLVFELLHSFRYYHVVVNDFDVLITSELGDQMSLDFRILDLLFGFCVQQSRVVVNDVLSYVNVSSRVAVVSHNCFVPEPRNVHRKFVNSAHSNTRKRHVSGEVLFELLHRIV